MLKDKRAAVTLARYASACAIDDPEFSKDVAELALRAGPHSPFCQDPD